MKTLDDENTLDNLTDKNSLNWYKTLYNIENNTSLSLLNEKNNLETRVFPDTFEYISSKDFYTEYQTKILKHTQLICKCKEKLSITKKNPPKLKKQKKERSEGRGFYLTKVTVSDDLELDLNLFYTKTFRIKYEKNLSSLAKFVLRSFERKYLYYAIDDILYSFKSNSKERDNLLAMLYSSVLSLQNNLFIDFFDIWIFDITINEVSNRNKFLRNNFQNVKPFNYITIKLAYRRKIPSKKQETLW